MREFAFELYRKHYAALGLGLTRQSLYSRSYSVSLCSPAKAALSCIQTEHYEYHCCRRQFSRKAFLFKRGVAEIFSQ